MSSFSIYKCASGLHRIVSDLTLLYQKMGGKKGKVSENKLKFRSEHSLSWVGSIGSAKEQSKTDKQKIYRMVYICKIGSYNFVIS